MHDHQLMFIIKLVCAGSSIKEVEFKENGDMLIEYYDTGANFYHVMLTGSNRLVVIEGKTPDKKPMPM